MIKDNHSYSYGNNNFKLLSEIGQQITSCLSVEKIIETAYRNINQLMDASSFWIGIYNESSERLEYPSGKEKGNTISYAYYNISDDKWLPVQSFKTQKEIFVNDYKREYNNYIPNSPPPVPVAGEMPESSIWYPLISKENKTIGILTIQSFNKNAYTEYHLDIVRNLAVFTSIALENALLYRQVKERTVEVVKQKEKIEQSYQDVKLLSEIGQAIISSLSVEKIIATTYENVNKLMDASGFGIGLLEKDGNALLFPMYMEEGKKLKMIKYSTSDKNRLPIWCLDNNRNIFINDFESEVKDFIRVIQKPLAGRSVNSLIYLPLEVKGKVIGVITVQSFHKNAYSENHLNILKNLAVFAEIALENAMLHENLEDKVKERTAEVVMQKNEADKQRGQAEKCKGLVEEKNKNIIDSINYAKRIQDALLKEEDHVSEHLPAHFILFKPKDIISGDFYWSIEKEGHLYLVAADCTGHGVPGAMMSMLGIAFLNEISSTPQLLSPADILEKLRNLVIKELCQTGKEGTSNDGMDISAARLNLANNELQWAGANNPLWLIKNNQLLEIKPNKQPIGFHSSMETFSNHTMQLEKGMSFFLFTDGYIDQFGGPNGKKFKHSYLKNILLSIDQKPMIKQKEILNDIFENWKGDLDQVDDVCIIGMKI